MAEKRGSARHRVLKAATIDLSETGAALDVTSQTGMPERFAPVVDAVGGES